MRKMKRGSAILFALFTTVFLLAVTITVWPMALVGMAIVKTFLLTTTIVAAVLTTIDTYKWLGDKPNSIDYDERNYYGPLNFLYKKCDENTKSIKLRFWIIGAILCVLLFYISHIFVQGVKQSVVVYNTSTVLHNKYDKKTFERKGFYDKMWKTFTEQKDITFLNKDVLVQVAKIAMDNRKDGQNVMWKWVQENQPMPYGEFTKFYSGLIEFITEQRKLYFALELECQAIANQNNILLDTFPNNIYNKVLGCKKIEFEYAFTSDSTEKVFRTKREK